MRKFIDELTMLLDEQRHTTYITQELMAAARKRREAKEYIESMLVELCDPRVMRGLVLGKEL